jgi:hypothetical protein
MLLLLLACTTEEPSVVSSNKFFVECIGTANIPVNEENAKLIEASVEQHYGFCDHVLVTKRTLICDQSPYFTIINTDTQTWSCWVDNKKVLQP